MKTIFLCLIWSTVFETLFDPKKQSTVILKVSVAPALFYRFAYCTPEHNENAPHRFTSKEYKVEKVGKREN